MEYLARSHRCSGATVGEFLTSWQAVQAFTISSTSWSSPGHQMWLRASDLVQTTPGCPWCNSLNTCFRSLYGTTTYIPHNPYLTDNFFRWLLNGFNSSTISGGQPTCVYLSTLARTGSVQVAAASCLAVTGRTFNC